MSKLLEENLKQIEYERYNFTTKRGGKTMYDVKGHYQYLHENEMFNLPKMLLANLLIARVSSSTDLNHKCSFGELNFFSFLCGGKIKTE